MTSPALDGLPDREIEIEIREVRDAIASCEQRLSAAETMPAELSLVREEKAELEDDLRFLKAELKGS